MLNTITVYSITLKLGTLYGFGNQYYFVYSALRYYNACSVTGIRNTDDIPNRCRQNTYLSDRR